MSDPSDEKIELLVRSVLTAVDARLAEVRSEIDAVATDVERRHREVLTHLQALEHRWENQVATMGPTGTDGDPLAARMEQATQVLLERIEAMHQRTTVATNERFALINQALEQLNGEVVVPPAIAVPMANLDVMTAPLRVGPPTGQVPAATLPIPEPAIVEMPIGELSPTPVALVLPPILPLHLEIPEPSGDEYVDESEPIDMSRLADLLSERLGSLSLPMHHLQN